MRSYWLFGIMFLVCCESLTCNVDLFFPLKQDGITGSPAGFQESTGVYCHGCFTDLSASQKEDQEPGVVLQCSECKHLFCFDCDVYVHESLHNCPGCESLTDRHAHEDENGDDMMSPD